jgi:hypothetical protein
MSAALSRAAHHVVGDQLRTTGIDEALPVISTVGQWVTVMHPEKGPVRFHVSDDRLPGRLDAWRANDLLLEVAP